ncbi:GAF domain-containing sensor histidine kinase [Microbispora sp. NEAU-D428]|uniref:GAF domain-containing sensor histidine kinase n=1 Tax=Microbispora sitophila TaxID=2771537 RepID=UPI001867368E|nr:GAF domain-containing sensor histidine kinase [Microbispora sitophila]MBE3014120.1 GAF domain-containing sensor histidine kinase [Microbispora sitophila]
MTDRSARRAAVAAGALLVLVLGTLVVEPRLRQLGVTGIVERFDAFRAVAALSFGVPGLFVVAQRPGSRVGWVMVIVGTAQALGLALGAYGLLGINGGIDGGIDGGLDGGFKDGAVGGGTGLPGDDWAMWVSNWLWIPAYLLVPTIFLLIFPDGRLPSRRWWSARAAAYAGIGVHTLDWMVRPVTYEQVPGLFPKGYAGVLAGLTGVPDALRTAGTVCTVGAVLAAVGSLVVRYRSAGEEVRRRLQWVLAAALLTVGLLGVALFVPSGPVIVAFAAVPLPVAVSVAVVAHRLWDLDLLLSRALAFGAVSVALLAAYALVAATLGNAIGSGASALIVALAVHPLYLRVSAAANRLVYGDRDDPARALRRLGVRLSDAGAPGDLLERMAAEVGRVLRMHYVAVEESGAVVASWGRPSGVGADMTESVPLLHQGEPVGTLVLGERLRPKDRALLAQLAPHVAVAVRAHRLGADLERSHGRLLAARQEERDRLLYELHDGLGPTLAALALQVDRGRRLVDADPEGAKQVLEELSGRIRGTVENVRAIVNDLRPPPLDALGLTGALAELGRGFAGDLAVEVEAPPDLPALPPPVELAAYRIAAEAMTNAVRHAMASRCTVSLRAGDAPGVLELRVDDDGVGVGSPARRGFGLASMRRRSEELNGTFELLDQAGAGTHLVVRLPLAVR